MSSRIIGFTAALLILLSIPQHIAAQPCGDVGQSLGTYTGRHEERRIDKDGDGLIDELEFLIEVQAEMDASVWVEGTLTKGGRSLLLSLPAWVNQMPVLDFESLATEQQLKAGQKQNFSYRVPASWLREAGVDGPYDVSITVGTHCALGPMGVVVDFSTANYKHTEFDSGTVEIRNVRAEPFDYDLDGKLDGVIARANLLSDQDAEIQILGRLTGSDGEMRAFGGNGNSPLSRSLKKGVSEDISFFFQELYGNEGPAYNFNELTIIVVERKGPQVSSAMMPVSLQGIFPPANRPPFHKAPPAHIKFSKRGIDRDKNGFFEEWELDVLLSPMQRGQHKVYVSVENNKGDWIYSKDHFCEEKDGRCQFTISLPSTRLIERGADGTQLKVSGSVYYHEVPSFQRLAKLKLISKREEEMLVKAGVLEGPLPSDVPLVFTTAEIEKSEPSEPVYLYQNIKKEFRDLDGDGKRDVLSIVASVNVHQNGPYVFNGQLYSAAGKQLGFFSTKTNLDAGKHDVSLDIPASALKESSESYAFHDCSFYLDQGRETPREFFAKYICR